MTNSEGTLTIAITVLDIVKNRLQAYLQFIKVLTSTLKLNMGLLAYSQQFLGYLNACWKNRSHLLSTLTYQLFCALTEKTIVLSTHSFG